MAQRRTWKKQVTSLPKGKKIQGKWHKKKYEIMGKLGEGAIGTVYLCQTQQGIAALKISEKQTSITMEVNVLKALKQARGGRLGPALLDVDDWKSADGTTYSFYVMEYVRGERLDNFIKRHGPQVIGTLLYQLLDSLESLHREGWVFGDLKLDNLIVRTSPANIRWVDVGGTTQLGRSIKEYTELYDRGYWGLGSRRAEPKYDLFSLAMVFLVIYHPNLKRPSPYNEKFLLKEIDRIPTLKPYAMLFKKAVSGKYNTASEMKDDLKKVTYPLSRGSRIKVTKNSNSLKEASWIFLISFFYFIVSILVM